MEFDGTAKGTHWAVGVEGDEKNQIPSRENDRGRSCSSSCQQDGQNIGVLPGTDKVCAFYISKDTTIAVLAENHKAFIKRVD
jgi:hypothetical protein